MRLASLLPHPSGQQFEQKYVSITAGPEAGSSLEASICSEFDVSGLPALYLRYKLPTADAADSEPKHIFAAASYGDAANYIVNYDSNALLGENGDCVSVDANNQPAVWVLIKQQQAAAEAAAAAAAACAVQGQAVMNGAAAGGVGLQQQSTSTAGSSASAATGGCSSGTTAAAGKPPGNKLQRWMQLARDTAVRLLLCVRVAGTPDIAFVKISNKLKLTDADGEGGTQQSYTICGLYHCFRGLQLAHDTQQLLTTAYTQSESSVPAARLISNPMAAVAAAVVLYCCTSL
jgi:hypothetical protein